MCFKNYIYLFFILNLGVFASCGKGKTVSGGKGKTVARVNDIYLYESDIKDLVSNKQTTPEDSIKIVHGYINEWAKNQLVLKAAQESSESDPDIERMVQSYRQSLLREKYQQKIIGQSVDTLINPQQYLDFYSQNAETFKLEATILRCYFIKAPKNIEGLDSLNLWWPGKTPEQLTTLIAFSRSNKLSYLLDENNWIDIDRLTAEMPKNTLSDKDLYPNKEMTKEIEGFMYYLKIFEIAKQGNPAPVGYVRDKIKTSLMFARKNELIEQMREELFNQAKNKGKIEIY